MKDLELESAVASALATSCRILPKGVIATPENFKARIKVLSALGFGITDGTLQLDGAISLIDEVKTTEEEVRAALRNSEVTSAAVARELRIATTTISNWLNYVIEFSYSRVTEIAEIIGYDMPTYDVPAIRFVFSSEDL